MTILRPSRYRPTSKSTTLLRWLAVVFLIWNVIETQVIYYRIAQSEREALAKAVLVEPPRVFIASLHWNNEKILRSEWNKGVVELVRRFGPENVFVSVYESGSWDQTKAALRELDTALGETGVGRKIVLENETHKDLIDGKPGQDGWITIPDGRKFPRRIPYLSKLRNLSLQPLMELAANGTTFDHVLFLGDVVFDVSDIITLLKTNNGHYAAACSMDYSKPPLFYDTFALRDARGHEHATQTWPYFRASKSRKAMLNAEPVPVSSCWNGIVAMPASTFTGITALRFRGLPDTLATYHLEASECCLIHADNPISRTKGVFVNPAVRVGYSREAYDKVHPYGPSSTKSSSVGKGKEGGGKSGSWLSLLEVWTGLWRNRFARWFTTSWFEEREVRGRIEAWMRAGRERKEGGGFCVIDEMQVVANNGWRHL